MQNEMKKVVDLDAARAARREANGEAPTVTFKDKTFTMPNEMPYAVLEAIAELSDAQASQDGTTAAKSVKTITQALFENQYDEFRALNPSMADIMFLMGEISEAYGMNLGEQPASGS